MKFDGVNIVIVLLCVALSLSIMAYYPVLMEGGDYNTHRSMTFGLEYPNYLHLLAQSVGIDWSIVNALSIGLFVGVFYAYYRWKGLLLSLSFSNMGYVLFTGGLAPTLISLTLIIIALNTNRRWLSLLTILFSRSAFAIGALLCTKNNYIRVFVMMLALAFMIFQCVGVEYCSPVYVGVMNYASYSDAGFIFELADWLPLIMLFMVGVWKKGIKEDYIWISIMALLIAPFTYPGRLFFVFAVLGIPRITQGFDNFGKWKYGLLVFMIAVQISRLF